MSDLVLYLGVTACGYILEKSKRKAALDRKSSDCSNYGAGIAYGNAYGF